MTRDLNTKLAVVTINLRTKFKCRF